MEEVGQQLFQHDHPPFRMLLPTSVTPPCILRHVSSGYAQCLPGSSVYPLSYKSPEDQFVSGMHRTMPLCITLYDNCMMLGIRGLLHVRKGCLLRSTPFHSSSNHQSLFLAGKRSTPIIRGLHLSERPVLDGTSLSLG